MNPTHLARWTPWLAAALGATLTLAIFWPGYMSWDSAWQWHQARTGEYDSVHPPLLALIWSLSDRVVEGPGGMLLLQCLLVWSALAALAARLFAGAAARGAFVLLVGFWPPLFGLLPHVWKDVWMHGFFAWAVVLLSSELQHPSRARLLGALALLAGACAFRHNAIAGAAPFALWIAWRWLAARAATREVRLTPALGLGLAPTVAIQLAASLPNALPGVRRVDSIWSVVALWDIAGVSLRERRLLYPDGFADPALTQEELRAHFSDFSNTTIYETGKLRHSFDAPYTDAQRTALRNAWLTLPFAHPRAWFAHRLRLAALLFGWDRAALPNHQVLQPGLHPIAGNPSVPPHASPWHAPVLASLTGLIDTPLFAGWLYLLVNATALAWAWRQRREPRAALAAVVAGSALAYALPLALISGSAEFRYLGWLVLATPIALALLLPPRAQRSA